MMDVMTNKPVTVFVGEKGVSTIRLPVSQLEQVKQLLSSHDVYHWVSENYFSWDGGPQTTIIYLRLGTDPAKVQAILDSVP